MAVNTAVKLLNTHISHQCKPAASGYKVRLSIFQSISERTFEIMSMIVPRLVVGKSGKAGNLVPTATLKITNLGT